MPGWLGLISGLGGALAIVATYWDDSWHTDRGRDEFLIAPHLLLYGGVLATALTVATWGVLAWRASGWGLAGIAKVLRDPALVIAAIGGLATLGAGPIDAAWHTAYGRDAVLWSPPHLLAVTGTLALSVGLLAGLRSAPGRLARIAQVLAAAGVLGALQIPVLEYDSDVPQFSTVWFLPVATLGLCLALRLLDDLLPSPTQQVWAAVALTAIRTTTVGALAAMGFSLTVVPPVLALVVLAAALRRTRLGAAARLVVIGAITPLVWWPVLEIQSSVTTTLPAAQLPAAVLLGALAGGLVSAARGDLRPRVMATPVALLVLLTTALVGAGLLTASPALAHDPGQGRHVALGLLTVSRASGQGETATLELGVPGDCQAFTPVATVARRAGRTLRGSLTATAADVVTPDGSGRTPGCVLRGSVNGLSQGRWFVYAEAVGADGARLEAWLAVQARERKTEVREIYTPPGGSGTGGRNTVGALVLLGVAALLIGCLRLAGRVAAREVQAVST